MGDKNVREDPAYYRALGRAIKLERVARGMERRNLAEASGVSYPYLSEIESGSKRPSSRALLAIAEALGVPPSSLMGAAEALEDEALHAANVAGMPADEESRRIALRRSRWFGQPLMESPMQAAGAPPPPSAAPSPSRSADDASSPMLFERARATRGRGHGHSEDSLREIVRLLGRLSPEDLAAVADLVRRLAR